MEDDDEFGDLYTDVLRPFTSSKLSSSASQPQQPSLPPHSVHRPIDLNHDADDDEILLGASNYNSSAGHLQAADQTLPSHQVREPTPAASIDSVPNLTISVNKEGLKFGGDVGVSDRDLEVVNYRAESDIEGIRDKDVDLVDKDVKFDIEEGNNGIEDVCLDSIIPGLSPGGNLENMDGSGMRNGAGRGGGDGGGDDWEDSDSEDDLHIVLNESNRGPMGTEGGGMGGEDEDDEDDELVIVAGGELNQSMEERDWGEDVAQAGDGERKEMGGEGGEASGGIVAAPKIGYSSHGYHPFHSQFKYVRPGAAPIPGVSASGPGGAPGQVRPPANMGPIAGRGRGDWRPTGIKNGAPMQKGFGMPPWGNNMGVRGFGGGLEFTLPSHKTIFEVDPDSFQEKPWKYPGVDVSDYFNFGLNEDGWKEYCKQLEQLRVEATMQSKIRVYESGRTEQEYDPDLPPELAAAAGIRDNPSDNANLGKPDVPLSDAGKGLVRPRPPIPTGRAIQVESGYGERLPSIDTRPPRIRDSDAIIEIVLEDPGDDDFTTENETQDQQDKDLPMKDFRGENESEEVEANVGRHYDGELPESHNGRKREVDERRMPNLNSVRGNIREGDAVLLVSSEGPFKHSDSREHTPSVYHGENVGSDYDEREAHGNAHEKSPHSTPSRSLQDKSSFENQKEESVESIDGKHSPRESSPVNRKTARESSLEYNDDEPVLGDGKSQMRKEEINFDTDAADESLNDEMEKKLEGEHPALNDEEDSKAGRSSENSKARSGSSRDYQKWRDGMEEEVIQDRRSSRMGSVNRQIDNSEPSYRREEVERNRMVAKGRDESYTYKDWDPSPVHQLHLKNEGFDRRKERESIDGPWQRREDDSYSRKIRPEDARKRDRSDEMVSRNRGKVREIERSSKGEHIQARKQLDNGPYAAPYEKDFGSRQREREDSLKTRYENVDDRHMKRRKDEEYIRRDHMDKEEVLYGHRESTSHRKRGRDEMFDHRKREDPQRIRDDVDDHYSIRYKEEWVQRERGERQREREDWHRSKQLHEENIPKREREDGRGGVVRVGRSTEEKAWVGHSRMNDDNKVLGKEHGFKDMVRHGEQSKRRDRVEEESSQHRGREDAYARGNQPSTEDRRSRHEKSINRNDRVINASDNQVVHEKKNKESTRKNKEPNGGDRSIGSSSKRNQDDQNSHNHERGLKGSSDRFPRKHKEDGSSEDEQPDTKRGRSKLERWTSHKERDLNVKTKSSSSTLQSRETDKNNNNGEPSEPSRHPADPIKAIDSNQHSSSEKKEAGDLENKDSETKQPLEDKHLDTVEKLKKRSERFKLPLPNEKEALSVKKVESETLPSVVKREAPTDSEVKPERPARKRRWISS